MPVNFLRVVGNIARRRSFFREAGVETYLSKKCSCHIESTRIRIECCQRSHCVDLVIMSLRGQVFVHAG